MLATLGYTHQPTYSDISILVYIAGGTIAVQRDRVGVLLVASCRVTRGGMRPGRARSVECWRLG